MILFCAGMTGYANTGTFIIALLLVFLCLLMTWGAQQSQPISHIDEKSEQIVNRAIEVIGGAPYLKVTTVTGRGFYSQYKEGASQVPLRFVDYLAYPDKERTEFTGEGVRVVQANSGEQGWIFDGATRTIKDLKATQVEDFKISMRTSYENLLRGWWHKAGASASYAGRREAGLARRNETVRLTYPDGFWVEYEFDAKGGLPAKVIYKRQRKNPDSGENEETTEEDHLLKPVSSDGITAPFVIDHFIAGQQSSRINYESIEYNRPLPDSLFAKPASIKALK